MDPNDSFGKVPETPIVRSFFGQDLFDLNIQKSEYDLGEMRILIGPLCLNYSDCWQVKLK